MKKPYYDIKLNENTTLRGFNKTVNSLEMVWHRDRIDRVITIQEGKGWQFQRDNELPFLLKEDDQIAIPAGQWHKLYKGQTNLIVVINEGKKKKKKADGYRSVRKRADNNPKVTKMDFLPDDTLDKIAKEKALDEKSKLSKYQRNKYDATLKSQRGKTLAKGNKVKGDSSKLPASYWDQREKDEKKEREKPGYKTRKRSDSIKEGFKLTKEQLRALIMEVLEEEVLNAAPAEDDANMNEKLSAKTKATLKKKAEKRGFTPGSVYAEYRKGLAAWGTSGSRKGMSQHQWAHARVNSATPSKDWAVVKKTKKKKK